MLFNVVAGRRRLALSLLLCCRFSHAQHGPQPSQPAAGAPGFHLAGLTSPAEVVEVLYASAPELPSGTTVTFLLNGRAVAQSQRAPFWLTNRPGGAPGLTLDKVTPGLHRLTANATLASGKLLVSNTVELRVMPSINTRFSTTLAPYGYHPGIQQKPAATTLRETSTPGAELSAAESAARQGAIEMYNNLGLDPALDITHDQSTILVALNPSAWALGKRPSTSEPLSLQFSPDAPFYQLIPKLWPRVPLPAGYIRGVQLNTAKQGDGIGFGETVATAQATAREVHSQWYNVASTRKTFTFSMVPDWFHSLPEQAKGDMHMIFVDPVSQTFFSTYKTSLDASTGGPDALYASSPASLNSLGDHGGSIAAGFAELPTMLQPGEATDATHPIRHALGGAVARTWAARVYPANSWDAGIRTSVNSCTGKGFTNTGVVPYGGVVQLDPALDLKLLKLSLPARRILEAIQNYGYYIEDFGCSDLDIYTAIPEDELAPFGGLWGFNRKGIGVQNEVEKVLTTHRLYLVAPLMKR